MNARDYSIKKFQDLNIYYDGKPYSFHLDDVLSIIHTFGYNNIDFIDFDYYLEDTVFLHDIIEDTDETELSLKSIFNPITARAVYYCSDEYGENRTERKSLTNLKFKKLNPSLYPDMLALIVKPADRLANMRYSFSSKSSMMKRYFKEYSEFRSSIYRNGVCDAIWLELDEEYKKYCDFFIVN